MRGTRFDGTVALPIDAADRLERIIRGTRDQLREVPDPGVTRHRAVALRVQLERRLQASLCAQQRLAAGTYGVCVDCAAPVSLTLLLRQPWTPRCIHCALDI